MLQLGITTRKCFSDKPHLFLLLPFAVSQTPCSDDLLHQFVEVTPDKAVK